MKLKQIKPKKLLKAFLKIGFTAKRQKGSHVFLERITNGERKVTSISLHNEVIPKGTLKAIFRQSGVSEEEIKSAL